MLVFDPSILSIRSRCSATEIQFPCPKVCWFIYNAEISSLPSSKACSCSCWQDCEWQMYPGALYYLNRDDKLSFWKQFSFTPLSTKVIGPEIYFVFLEWSLLDFRPRENVCSSIYKGFLTNSTAVHFVPQFSYPFCLQFCHFPTSFHFMSLLPFRLFPFFCISFFPFSIFLRFKLLVFADYDPYAMAGVCNDHGKTYALYAITVRRRTPNGEEVWKTYRRYSDFHDFHMRITEQVMAIVKSSSFLNLFLKWVSLLVCTFWL